VVHKFSADVNNGFIAAGREFYVQWRQRFDSSYINNIYTPSGAEGPKQVMYLRQSRRLDL